MQRWAVFQGTQMPWSTPAETLTAQPGTHPGYTQCSALLLGHGEQSNSSLDQAERENDEMKRHSPREMCKPAAGIN